MNQKLPQFRCEKCGALNLEVSKKTSFFKNPICSKCNKSSGMLKDILLVKPKENLASSEFKGFVLNQQFTFLESNINAEITIPVSSIDFISDKDGFLEVNFRRRRRQSKQPIRCKLKEEIEFVWFENEQVIRVQPDDIAFIIFNHSFSADSQFNNKKSEFQKSKDSVVDGLFGLIFQNILPPYVREIMEVMDAGGFTEQSRKEYVDKNKHYILARKDEISALYKNFGENIRMMSMESPITSLIMSNPTERVGGAIEECWKQLILAEELEALELKSEADAPKIERLSPEEIAQKAVEQVKQRCTTIEKLVEESKKDIADTKDPEMREMKKRMYADAILEVQDE